MLQSSPPLPKFSRETTVHARPEGEIEPGSPYAQAAQQYATSSATDAKTMQPAQIIYPATEADIALAIRYAREAGVRVSIRSGGHAYHGGSSTGGRNIQIDTSRCADCKVWRFDAGARRLTVGTGWKLGQVQENLRNNYLGYPTKGYFFAHGNCAGVGLGGHLQTGGYSMQTRSFGLFIDYVTSFRIITADGVIRDVRKPDPSAPDPDNDDLWFAVLGGGPGSFGVCTQVCLRLLHDDEFPESRAYMQSYVWTKRNGTRLIEALLQYMAERSDRDDLPADFCLHVAVASAAPKYFRWENILRDAASTGVGALDQVLSKKLRRSTNPVEAAVAGRLLAAARRVFGARGGRNPLFEASVVPIIIVQASWNNLSGDRRDYDDSVKAFFKELDDVAVPYLPEGIRGQMARRALRIIDPGEHLPVTEIIDAFTFKGEREYDLPYLKRNWAGYGSNMSRRGFAREAARMFAPFTHSIFSASPEAWDGNVVGCAWGYLGGSQSNMTRYAATTGTAMPHRSSRIAWMTDYFYDPSVEGAAARLKAWVARYDSLVVGSEDAFFSTKDARFMFAPFDAAPIDDQVGPPSLDRLRAHLYDSEADYQRVLATKRRWDPDGLFSAHRFSVGADGGSPA